MVEDYGFKVIDASRSIEEVFADLKSQVSDILDNANPVLAESISSSRQFHNGHVTQTLGDASLEHGVGHINPRVSLNGTAESQSHSTETSLIR